MRIAIIITDLTGKGGTERTTILLANTLKKYGHDITIISLFKKNLNPAYELDRDVGTVYLLKEEYSHSLFILKRINLLLKSRLYLKRYLKNNLYNHIICQTFLPTILNFSIGQRKRTIVCEHFKYDLYNKFGIRIRNLIYSFYKKIVTLTQADAKKFIEVGLEAVVIPNMVTFPIAENHGQSLKKIVTAGRLCHQKGFDMLLKSMKILLESYPDWSLDIYGEGELEDELKKLADDLCIRDNVNFMGFCDNLPSVFQKSTFFVMSSRYEGFPMILLEATSQNLPCISFECPEGPSEILRNGGGLLVSPEDTKSLANAMIKFIESPELRIKCTKQALLNIQSYTPEKIYEKWIALFKTL